MRAQINCKGSSWWYESLFIKTRPEENRGKIFEGQYRTLNKMFRNNVSAWMVLDMFELFSKQNIQIF